MKTCINKCQILRNLLIRSNYSVTFQILARDQTMFRTTYQVTEVNGCVISRLNK